MESLIPLEFALYLKSIGLSDEEYQYLMRYVDDPEEAERIRKLEPVTRVNALFEHLNEYKLLLEEYKDFVKDYKGFRGMVLPR